MRLHIRFQKPLMKCKINIQGIQTSYFYCNYICIYCNTNYIPWIFQKYQQQKYINTDDNKMEFIDGFLNILNEDNIQSNIPVDIFGFNLYIKPSQFNANYTNLKRKKLPGSLISIEINDMIFYVMTPLEYLYEIIELSEIICLDNNFLSILNFIGDGYDEVLTHQNFHQIMYIFKNNTDTCKLTIDIELPNYSFKLPLDTKDYPYNKKFVAQKDEYCYEET